MAARRTPAKKQAENAPVLKWRVLETFSDKANGNALVYAGGTFEATEERAAEVLKVGRFIERI